MKRTIIGGVLLIGSVIGMAATLLSTAIIYAQMHERNGSFGDVWYAMEQLELHIAMIASLAVFVLGLAILVREYFDKRG